jgi:hypothetical protein
MTTSSLLWPSPLGWVRGGSWPETIPLSSVPFSEPSSVPSYSYFLPIESSTSLSPLPLPFTILSLHSIEVGVPSPMNYSLTALEPPERMRNGIRAIETYILNFKHDNEISSLIIPH